MSRPSKLRIGAAKLGNLDVLRGVALSPEVVVLENREGSVINDDVFEAPIADIGKRTAGMVLGVFDKMTGILGFNGSVFGAASEYMSRSDNLPTVELLETADVGRSLIHVIKFGANGDEPIQPELLFTDINKYGESATMLDRVRSGTFDAFQDFYRQMNQDEKVQPPYPTLDGFQEIDAKIKVTEASEKAVGASALTCVVTSIDNYFYRRGIVSKSLGYIGELVKATFDKSDVGEEALETETEASLGSPVLNQATSEKVKSPKSIEPTSSLSEILSNFIVLIDGKPARIFNDLQIDDNIDPDYIRSLFRFDGLSLEQGFYLLAVFEILNKKSNEYVYLPIESLEDELVDILCKKLKLTTLSDNAAKYEVIDLLFHENLYGTDSLSEDQLDLKEKLGLGKITISGVMARSQEYVNSYLADGGDIKRAKSRYLGDSLKALNLRLRAGEISYGDYVSKRAHLVDEADEFGLGKVLGLQSGQIVSDLWNNPVSQWARDRFSDIGRFVGKKTISLAVIAPLMIGGKGLLGTSLYLLRSLKLAKVVKYPFLVGGKLIAGALNGLTDVFFGKRLVPSPNISSNILSDLAQARGYFTSGYDKTNGFIKSVIPGIFTNAAKMFGGYNRVGFAEKNRFIGKPVDRANALDARAKNHLSNSFSTVDSESRATHVVREIRKKLGAVFQNQVPAEAV